MYGCEFVFGVSVGVLQNLNLTLTLNLVLTFFLISFCTRRRPKSRRRRFVCRMLQNLGVCIGLWMRDESPRVLAKGFSCETNIERDSMLVTVTLF